MKKKRLTGVAIVLIATVLTSCSAKTTESTIIDSVINTSIAESSNIEESSINDISDPVESISDNIGDPKESSSINKDRISLLITGISELPEAITLDSKGIVVYLSSEYSSLSDDEKSQVTNYEKLENAVKAIKELEDTKETRILSVNNLIANIPNEIYVDDKEYVNYVNTEYLKLSSEEKNEVSKYSKLEKAISEITKLEAKLDLTIDERNCTKYDIDIANSDPDMYIFSNGAQFEYEGSSFNVNKGIYAISNTPAKVSGAKLASDVKSVLVKLTANGNKTVNVVVKTNNVSRIIRNVSISSNENKLLTIPVDAKNVTELTVTVFVTDKANKSAILSSIVINPSGK